MPKKASPTWVGTVSVHGQEGKRPGWGGGRAEKDYGAGTVLFLDLGEGSPVQWLTHSAGQLKLSPLSVLHFPISTMQLIN